MTDHAAMMMLLMGHQSFLGPAEEVENSIMPLDSQLTFGPGDAALMATANIPLESDRTVLRAVDPSRHAETFPDWEERLLNSYVLCEAFSEEDPEITLGWYSRLKTIPIKKYRYWQARRWIKEGWPEDQPDWVVKTFIQFTDAMADRAPDVVPHPPTCENCGGREMQLKITRSLSYGARAGCLVIEGQRRYVPLSDIDEDSTHLARLVCPDCGEATVLSDDDWHLPGISN